MNSHTVFLKGWSAWAPGLETIETQREWAAGRAAIRQAADAPPLSFLPMLFRRRLSQLSKMVLQVGHALAGDGGNPSLVFASRFGEVNKQFQITDALIASGEVSPGVFSLSVFNAPVFLLSIAEHIHAAGNALYTRDRGAVVAMMEALGILLRPESRDCLVLFGEEYLPAPYRTLVVDVPEPYAFGMLISRESAAGCITLEIELTDQSGPDQPEHPLTLLRWLLSGKTAPLFLPGPGMSLRVRRTP